MFGSVSICIVTNVKYVLVSQVLFLKCNNSNTTGRISVELSKCGEFVHFVCCVLKSWAVKYETLVLYVVF